MGYVTKEEIECKSCGRIIRKNELQYDSPKGRICLNCYTGKQPSQLTPFGEPQKGSLARALVIVFLVAMFIGFPVLHNIFGWAGVVIMFIIMFVFVAILTMLGGGR